uniref:D-arabinono-1,4-lactone oxidase n=1 Tax=Marseillevirus LCMAC201 TaxID=2506605 RepID=A0A481YWW5_9VIRU|nr:MAG: D-arabinono-1,4-lactone oxidase [Marseillevirus LCMAC201]
MYFKNSLSESFSLFTKKHTEVNSVTPHQIYYPENLEEIQNIIVDNPGQTIRSSGDNHSCNNIFLTNDIIIRTDKLNNIINLDKEKQELTVESGCSIEDICKYLEHEELAIDISDNLLQTLGDVCSTAAHGSNLDTGTMSDQLVDVTVVLSNGHVRRIEFDDPEFPAYATSLGSLGIIYSITLKCVEYYFIQTERIIGKWANIKKNIINLLDDYALTTIHIKPVSLQTTIVLRKKVPLKKMVSSSTPEPYYKVLTAAESGKYTKSDVSIPYERVVEAVDDVLKLSKSQKISDYKLSICFTGPDYNSWLSPTSGRSSAWIQITTLKDITQKFIQDYEDLLLYKYSGRPNWTTGKFINTYKMRLLYGISIDYIRRVRERFDPTLTFSNDFIASVFN